MEDEEMLPDQFSEQVPSGMGCELVIALTPAQKPATNR
jgi:hypothetical protein